MDKIFIFILLFFSACTAKQEILAPDLQINIEHRVRNEEFKFQKRYLNDLKEEYMIEDFRYYISNIKLKGATAFFQETNSYHLIMPDSDNTTANFDLGKLPEGDYQTLEMSIGVDKIHNTDIQKVGDLDPSGSMAWDWTKGYKFFLLEGKYFTKNSIGEALVYHVGENNNYVTLSFPINLKIENGKNKKINLIADLNKIFKEISLNEINNVMFGEKASKVALNYKEMISLKNIE